MRRILIPLVVILSLLVAGANAAADDVVEQFSAERFDELQQEGAIIVVGTYASWCSTCRAQAPILDRLMAEAEFSKIRFLRLDWDKQRREGRRLGAPRQSTLIFFHGERRLGRSVAETREAKLREFLKENLEKADG